MRGGDTSKAAANIGTGVLPQEPLEIGQVPQFVCDLHVIDNTWALHEKQEPVKRLFHQAQKHAANPVLTGDEPSTPPSLTPRAAMALIGSSRIWTCSPRQSISGC